MCACGQERVAVLRAAKDVVFCLGLCSVSVGVCVPVCSVCVVCPCVCLSVKSS